MKTKNEKLEGLIILKRGTNHQDDWCLALKLTSFSLCREGQD